MQNSKEETVHGGEGTNIDVIQAMTEMHIYTMKHIYTCLYIYTDIHINRQDCKAVGQNPYRWCTIIKRCIPYSFVGNLDP